MVTNYAVAGLRVSAVGSMMTGSRCSRRFARDRPELNLRATHNEPG